MFGDGVPLALAFGAGLVAAVNPCGFAMLPSFIAFHLGAETSARDMPGRLVEGLWVGLAATAGFMLVFGTAGIAFAFGARELVRAIPWVALAMGIALAALGAWMLAGRQLVIRLPGLRAPQGAGYRSMFAFGTAYALGSLSCTLPVFLVVVGSAVSAGSAPGTLAVFLAYGLGMASVLMALSLGIAGFRELAVRAIRPLMRHMGRVSGALLVAGGAYVTYYWASLLGGDGDSAPIRAMQDAQEAVRGLITGPDQRLWLALGLALVVGAALALALRPARVEGKQGKPGYAEPCESCEGGERGPEIESEARALGAS